MKNKLKYLVKYNLKKKFSSKTFKIVNILLLLLIPLVLNVDKVIEKFGGDFDKPTNIYVIDAVGVYDILKNTYESGNSLITNSNVEFSKTNENMQELESKIKKDESKDIIISLTKSKENIFAAEVVSFEYIDTILYQSLINSLNNTKINIALSKSDIDMKKLQSIYKEVTVDRILLNRDLDKNDEFITTLSSIIIPVFIIPFFFLIILVVQFIGAEINEEKSSKSMEIIISSVSPKTHFLSKIIATNVFVLLQGVALIIYAAVGIILRSKFTGVSFINSFGINTSDMIKSFMDSDVFINLLRAIPLVILVLILSFVVYSLLAGILASMTTSIEDYQQLQTPIMLVLLSGYYLSMFLEMYDSSIFIKIVSYIPFVSAILAPALFIVGQTMVVDILITIVMLIITCFILIKYGLKIYKVGILNYSSSKLWKKMFNAVKEK